MVIVLGISIKTFNLVQLGNSLFEWHFISRNLKIYIDVDYKLINGKKQKEMCILSSKCNK